MNSSMIFVFLEKLVNDNLEALHAQIGAILLEVRKSWLSMPTFVLNSIKG